jgi:hypothetical protein
MKIFLLFFLTFILLASCQTNNLAIDYDNGYNFSAVKTYNYYTDNDIRLNQIDSASFIRNLDAILQSKGLIKDMENPDVFIALQVYNRDGTQTNSVVNFGIGGGSRWLGLGTSVGIPIKRKVTDYSIQIDFDDAKTKTLIWTGHTAKTQPYNASPESKASFYRSNIQTLLKKYPPQRKPDKKSNYYD